MTDNPTTRPECHDRRKPEYWCNPFFGAACEQDSELLSNVAQWRHVRSKIDAMFNDPDKDRGEVIPLLDRLDSIQGRLAKATPLSFLGAADYLEIAAKAILAKHLDPDSADDDLTLALGLVARVEKAMRVCDVGWINRKDERAPSGGQTEAPGPVTELHKQVDELRERAHAVDKASLKTGDGPEKEKLGDELTDLYRQQEQAREKEIRAVARNLVEIGLKLRAVLNQAGLLEKGGPSDALHNFNATDQILSEGIRLTLRDVDKLAKTVNIERAA